MISLWRRAAGDLRRTVVRVNSCPEPALVRTALVSLYGAVAAVVRDDEQAVRLMLADLEERCAGLDETLIVISLATLERLADVPADDNDGGGHAAREVLSIADRFGSSSRRAVESAAWRLDAVRRGDQSGAVRDILRSRGLASEYDLARGAVTLLAAVVFRHARLCGRSPRRMAADLCLAASLAATRR